MKTTKKELRKQILEIRDSIEKENRYEFDNIISKLQREFEVNKVNDTQYRAYIPKENILKLNEWNTLHNIFTIALDIIRG